jgi:sec-independent protein translocase protein TatB
MFDIGWFEMAVVGALLLIVVGPKDLPKVLRTVGY